ncbi:hypothetical protein ACFOWE_28785 [Planomonospora corallina]|uniref:Uncharacterized protein n=1 Tax=Planomonospora corallina TaxID=1806052 RepID=A0ABV8IDV7_9ACTN
MTQPQQPELRRSGGAPTNDENLDVMPETPSGSAKGGRAHGTDKGDKGGGEGGGVPPDQQPPWPS